MENQPNDSFHALYEVTRTLNSILEPHELLEHVLAIAMRHLSAERGFLLLADSSREEGFSIAAVENFGPSEVSSKFAASSTVVRTVLDTGEPVLTADAQSDERFDSSVSIASQKIISILCVPLRSGERVTGAVYLDSSTHRQAFTEESMKFLTVFGRLAAVAIENAQRFSMLSVENMRLKNSVDFSHVFPNIIGKSATWKEVLNLVQRVLDVDAAVLLTGESGTGKELIARTIHENGNRAGKPFVAINCSAIPEQLLESELFGHIRGSFTGAVADKKGLVEVAHGGTLLLDEIADMPLALQSKLLRLLQEKEYRRVGDTTNRTVDIRVLAATNRDPQAEVKAGRFRADLYFRLNVVRIHLPPLRERRDDIPALAEYFLARAAKNYGRPINSIHPDAMHILLSSSWRGNVREFQNMIERAVVLCRGTELVKEDFLFDSTDTASLARAGLTLDDLERQIIESTLAELKGNRTRTAERLGVSLRWLQYRLKEWGSQ
ncbi:MAG TPA: sigma 54-interacting transcriptional regulator [Bacteroidota bacterium]|nr:sigma 54-interacting transcriptional regulator [Bacteroidota bacterium]